jgi:glutathione S-transferase
VITLYDSRLSGNGWKVRLLLSHLGIPFTRQVLNLAQGEARTPEFLRLNPLARVPVLVLEDGTVICESDAILFYLAQGTPYLPSGAAESARVMQWLFFEQFDHARFFARPRYLVSIAKAQDKFAGEIEYLRQIGQKALVALEAQLSRTPFLAGSRYTIADIALFPYTSMAEMGGYELKAFPAVREWLERVRSQPGFIPLVDNQ